MERIGARRAGAGDVNADGRADVIVGAHGADNDGRGASGSAYVLYGFGAPMVSYAPLTGQVGQPIARLTPVVRRTGQASFVASGLPADLVIDPDGRGRAVDVHGHDDRPRRQRHG